MNSLIFFSYPIKIMDLKYPLRCKNGYIIYKNKISTMGWTSPDNIQNFTILYLEKHQYISSISINNIDQLVILDEILKNFNIKFLTDKEIFYLKQKPLEDLYDDAMSRLGYNYLLRKYKIEKFLLSL